MGRYYVLSGGEVIAEIEAATPFTATCAEEAECAPEGAMLVDLETGVAVASRSRLAANLIGWSFARHLEFGDEEATTSQRVA